jgi:hypothetical protein
MKQSADAALEWPTSSHNAMTSGRTHICLQPSNPLQTWHGLVESLKNIKAGR